MYKEINKAFNVRGRPVIFCWGGTIFNPAGIKITPELLVHETIHSCRQGSDPTSWWEDYIRSPDFRLTEEIPAHKAEFADVCTRLSEDSSARATALHRIAARLCSPLYGSMVDYNEAKHLIAS